MQFGVGANTQIGYAPFGGVQSWVWRNDSATHPNIVTRTYDLDGRLASYPLGNPAQNGLLRTVAYDAASRITAITHTGNGAGAFAPDNFTQTYGYDNLNRLASVGGTAAPALTFTYDANGNRIQGKVGAAVINYAISGSSNRISSTSGTAPPTANLFDSAGNTTGDGTITYSYSARGRLQSVSKAGLTVAYMYNGAGQRVIKSGTPVASGANLYTYDEQGHILGEYDAAGHALQETVFLDDLPVAVLSAQVPTVTTPPATPSGATNIYYVYADHIATPRVLVGASDGVIVWRWDATDPFGAQVPNENPSGLGAFAYNLRFSGQVFDKESGKNYNYFRDYDPQTGRYLPSDPIGLAGGLNTYGYVGGNPLSFTDPLELCIEDLCIGEAIIAARACAAYAPCAAGVAAIVGAAIFSQSNKQSRKDSHDAYKAIQRQGYQRDPNDPCQELRNKIAFHEGMVAARSVHDVAFPNPGWPDGKRHAGVNDADSKNIERWKKELGECEKSCKR